MPRKPTQKQRDRYAAEFGAAMLELITSKGATATDHGAYDYVLATPIGPLYLTIHEDWVPGCFESHRAGRIATGCSNPASGKWNHHYGLDIPVATAVADLTYYLDRVLAYVPDAECERVMREDIAEGEQRRAQFAIWRAELDAEKASKA